MDTKNGDADPAGLGNLLERMTLSDGQVASELGVSAASIRSWRTGRRSPSPANRKQLMAVARNHALAILRLIREMDGQVAPTGPGDSSMSTDLGDLRREMDRAGASAATIRRALEETTRLLARKG